MLVFKYSNGIIRAERNGVVIGQARTFEKLLENAVGDIFPEDVIFGASEVLDALFGDVRDTHGQIATREP